MIKQRTQKRNTALYHFLARVGAVTVNRGSLRQFAFDLGINPQSLADTIENMRVAGHATVDDDMLHLRAASRVAR